MTSDSAMYDIALQCTMTSDSETLISQLAENLPGMENPMLRALE